MTTTLWSFCLWRKLERWKNSLSRCLMSWLKIKKSSFWSIVYFLILHNNRGPFLDQIVVLDEKWIVYDNRQWPDQWLGREEAPKYFSSQICIKVQGHCGGLLLVWSLQLSEFQWSKTITSEKCAQKINEMHQNLQCLQQALVNRKGPFIHNNAPSHIAQPLLLNLNELGYNVCLICHSHLTSYLLTTMTSTILTTFCRGNASTTGKKQKMLSKSS